eukprot:341044-Pyramimonas_sp.AAC.1
MFGASRCLGWIPIEINSTRPVASACIQLADDEEEEDNVLFQHVLEHLFGASWGALVASAGFPLKS